MQIATKLGQYQNAMETPISKDAQVSGGLEVRGTQRVNSLLQQLKAGSIFEGTILKMENGQVQLGLSNGETLMAKLQADIQLLQGQSLFFQVKSNDGAKIQITPYMQGSQVANPALLQALQAAGLPQTEQNIVLVDAMMQQQMGIDKQSLGQMARLVQQHPQMDVQTLVQLQKLKLPLTQEMADQLSNYQKDSYALIKQMDTLLQELPSVLSGKNLSNSECVQVNQQILQLLTNQQQSETPVLAENQMAATQTNGETQTQPIQNQKLPDQEMGSESIQKEIPLEQKMSLTSDSLVKANETLVQTGAGENEKAARIQQDKIQSETAAQSEIKNIKNDSPIHPVESQTIVQNQTVEQAKTTVQSQMAEQAKTTEYSQAAEQPKTTEQSQTTEPTKTVEQKQQIVSETAKTEQAVETGLAASESAQKTLTSEKVPLTDQNLPAKSASDFKPVLSSEELQQLNQKLQEIIQKTQPQAESQHSETPVVAAKTETEFMQKLAKALQDPTVVQNKETKALFESSPYQKLISNSLKQQWTITPQQTAQKENVSNLYERMQRQVHELEMIFQTVSKSSDNLKQAASDIEQNLNFMNQVNQMYQYVQLPLKLAGQTMHSDLYVYTNRKGTNQNDDALSAFLHLDLDALGTTDIAVQMKGKHVDTQFYLSDSISSQLFISHSDTLQNMLEKKGYTCTVQVENKENKVRPLEQFLEKKSAAHTGKLQRYSFDVKA